MSESSSADASITFHQDGIRGFGSALINAQTYELFIDQQKVGELTGYTSEKTCSLSSGPHAIYVRAYARDSVSPTRIHGYSETLDIDLSPGEHKTFSCGLVPGPPLRKYLIFGGAAITALLAFGLVPLGTLSLRTRYGLVMVVALATIACGWLGYSSDPVANIYLKQA
jgi:hypothetical protein